MAIPEISKSDVLAAIARVDREGVPDERRSTRYVLVYKGRRYPPKYIVSLAVENATGRPLPPNQFGGGVETNGVLRSLGFSVDAVVREAADPEVDGGERRPVGPVGSLGGSKEVCIVRVVVMGEPAGPETAERVLFEALTQQWPKGVRSRFLLTPGGFAAVPFPDSYRGGTGWTSPPEALGHLSAYAQEALARVLSERVLRAAVERTSTITVGIDLVGDVRPEHAELVAVYDVARKTAVWTGKSYPTEDQAKTLVHITDLGTHFRELSGERVALLGCHDLNVFNPRGWATQDPAGVRRVRCSEMRRRMKAFRPTVVLQHPHSTDSPNIWRNAWGVLIGQVPSVKAWASGIAYCRRDDAPRATPEEVLRETKGGADCVDLCVRLP